MKDAAPGETVLELKNVSKIYDVRQGLLAAPKTLGALQDVSLRIQKGEILGLVGESGSGKSTLAKILLGLLQPTSGKVEIFGQSHESYDRRWIARRIQPIFQDPYSSLNPRKTVREIVGLPLNIHRIADRSEWDGRIKEMLDLVGLPQRLIDANPAQMSGGQRQRVAIARALIMKPEIVICDEPTSALDVSVQSQILNLLMELRETLGLTYLFISHNLAVVEHIATRVAVMYLGRIVEETPVEKLFDKQRHPYTRALMESVLSPEPSLGVPDVQIEGSFPNPISPPSGCAFHPRCAIAGPICSAERPELKGSAQERVACHMR
ncbi:MAG: ATP-binding cassette domain-containing protein [Rhodobacteraceae bacterium]|nr:ATP-binding cassette domain-containing protein [Paracoccaceae bacterium]